MPLRRSPQGLSYREWQRPTSTPTESVAEAIRKALDEIAPKTRAVTLIIPDTAVRVFVLDFDSLPPKASEAVPVLRFRLRKMVPFDVEPAAMSYQILVQNETTVKVLATVMPGPILAEYEAVVRSAGYEPGAVLPSSLASLASLDSMEPILAANLSSQALTTSITSGQDLHLFRTVELPEDPAARVAEVQRSIAVAAAYYEDKLVARPRQLHYAGIAECGTVCPTGRRPRPGGRRYGSKQGPGRNHASRSPEPGRHCRRPGGSVSHAYHD